MSCSGHPSAAARIWEAVEQVREDLGDSTVINTVMVPRGHIYDLQDPAW